MGRDLRSGMMSTQKRVLENLEKSTETVTKELSLSELEEHPSNEYLFGSLSEDELKGLAKSIRDYGFFGVINVWKIGEDKYMVFDGHRRKRAVEYNRAHHGGKSKVPCRVFPLPKSETMQGRMLLAGNIYNRGTEKFGSVIHTARQIKFMREILTKEGFKGNMKEQLALEFEWKPSSIQRYESLLKCSEDVIRAVDGGILPIEQASSLSVLDESKQQLVLQALDKIREKEDSLTKKEVQKVVDSVKKDFAESVDEILTLYYGKAEEETAPPSGDVTVGQEQEQNGSVDGQEEETGGISIYTGGSTGESEEKELSPNDIYQKFMKSSDKMDEVISFLYEDIPFSAFEKEKLAKKLSYLESKIIDVKKILA